MVAELAREIEILLDQHDRDLAEIAQVGDGAADILDDRGLDAFGRLVQQQEPRPHDQRPADRKLLLLAAGEVAAAAPEHAIEHGKKREHIMRDGTVLAFERRKTGLEIFLDREQGKDFAPLRNIGDAATGAVAGMSRVMSAPSSVMVPLLTGCAPARASRTDWSCRRRCGPAHR